MNITQFKKTLQQSVSEEGFKYYNKKYYLETKETIIVLDVQKSNYSDSYYINYGFLVKDIHDYYEKIKVEDCDIVGRFINHVTNKFDFELQEFDEGKLYNCVRYNIEHTIIPVMNEGICKYFELYPKAIMAARLELKTYINNM